MSELPMNWEEISLLEISDFVRGVTYTKSDISEIAKEGFIPVLRANNIQRDFDFDDLVYVLESRISENQKIKAGDVVIATSSGSINVVGKAVQAKTDLDAGFGAFCGLLRPSKFLNSNYFGHFFASDFYRKSVSSMARGVNINNLKPSHFNEISIPLAPIEEQKRIADKLDQLLARVDACRERLDRIPVFLKRFRQAVLAAATSGQLTEDWRNQNGLHDWKSVRLADVTEGKPKNGYSAKPVNYETPWRVLTLTATTSGVFVDKHFKYFDEKIPDESSFWCCPGDILVQRGNTIEYVGISAIYKGKPKAFIYPDLMMRVRAGKQIKKEFLHYSLLSESTRKFMRELATGTAGNMPKINQQVLLDVPLQIPALPEQQEIIRRVEKLFAYADRLEARYRAARAQVDRLAPALLAKAFRGELAPQDPDDEPASVLLERLRAERATIPAKSSKPRKTARPDP